MRGVVLHAPGDVRLEVRDDPAFVEPTDAIIRLSATCICGSDLWPYRGIEAVEGPPMPRLDDSRGGSPPAPWDRMLRLLPDWGRYRDGPRAIRTGLERVSHGLRR
jgi:hypothetical protein